ncbi:UNVERIFIED_CONTAM: hypothetical protein PYX00_007761 [Menopon gallinae]|uniref:Fibronectin type-III domain-containing protein n=1 Tax=Menopon gallinae TaxID=328185 RepID=A0AAW2HKI1_9NEOP
MCWASNSAGEQIEPCVFHIIAAGHPDSPFNCTILNQTTMSLEVECIEGFDGGQPQWFLLEVRDGQTGQLEANISNKFPVFSVNHLSPGQVLKLVVVAVNNKGRSESVFLEGYTLKVAEKQTGIPVTLDIAPVLGYLIGGCILLSVMAAVAAIAWKRSRVKSPDRPIALPLKEKVALPLRSDVDDLYEMDDKNPDVVPCNKDSDYQLLSEATTPGLQNRSSDASDDHFKRNNISRNGGIHENFKLCDNRVVNNKIVHSPNEVTYAELCMSLPGSTENKMKPPPNLGAQIHRSQDEPTIYAQIDHSLRPTPDGSLRSPMTPVSMTPKEIVTVRTPLMGHQQESCV